MWKTRQSAHFTPSSIPAQKPDPPVQFPPALDPVVRTNIKTMTVDQPTIGKGLVVNGDITGTGSLFIDGMVEGSVNLPGGRMTVGFNGRVQHGPNASSNLCITAHEIVIMGDVRGSVSADRVEIWAEGKLTGDVSTSSICIEDGGFFKGQIDIREAEVKGEESGAVAVLTTLSEVPKLA